MNFWMHRLLLLMSICFVNYFVASEIVAPIKDATNPELRQEIAKLNPEDMQAFKAAFYAISLHQEQNSSVHAASTSLSFNSLKDSFAKGINTGIVNGIAHGLQEPLKLSISQGLFPATTRVIRGVGGAIESLRFHLALAMIGAPYLTFERIAKWQGDIHHAMTTHLLEPAMAYGRVRRAVTKQETEQAAEPVWQEYKFGIQDVQTLLGLVKYSLERSHKFYSQLDKSSLVKRFIVGYVIASTTCSSEYRSEIISTLDRLIKHIDYVLQLCITIENLSDLTSKKDEFARVLKEMTRTFEGLCILIDERKTFDIRRQGVKLVVNAARTRSAAPMGGLFGGDAGMAASTPALA